MNEKRKEKEDEGGEGKSQWRGRDETGSLGALAGAERDLPCVE